MATKTKTRKASTTKTAKAPAKAKTAKQPVVVPPVEEARPMFASKEHIAVVSPISHARRALNEPAIVALLKRGPVSVEQLAERLKDEYGIPRSALNHQLDFELKKRKTPRFKLDSKGRLVVIGTIGPLAFRKQQTA